MSLQQFENLAHKDFYLFRYFRSTRMNHRFIYLHLFIHLFTVYSILYTICIGIYIY